MFQGLLDNLKIDNNDVISMRYDEITASLNKTFRDTDSKTANSLQVGSYGRWTAIKGISDLDMLYIMPATKWADYKDGKQYQLLSDTKDVILARYPRTEVFVDRLVVRVLYKNFHVEVQPVFENTDRSFTYPDTYNGGKWRVTRPREELKAMTEFVANKNKNLRRLCKMARAWKNKHGVAMGGLLIDTLAHNFLKSTNDYDDKSYTYYDWMARDFFQYLMNEPDKDHYQALGSGQDVKVKKKFQKKAKKAYELSLKAIEAGENDSANDKWKKIFGRPLPASASVQKAAFAEAAHYWRDTEEFIEDKYPIDIRYNLEIDCDVSQNGQVETLLRKLLSRTMKLPPKKSLAFKVVSIDVPQPFEIKWKILNRGDVAKRRDCIRGQIIDDGGDMQRVETTDFDGEHMVECFVVKNGVVVAKDRIDVPIQEG
jgi:hypothetical protein